MMYWAENTMLVFWILSKILSVFEKLCFRLVNVVLVDTREHREYFAHTVDLPVKRITVVPVGAREELFFPRAETSKDETRSKEVLVYGSMIPLHGADVIVRAAAHLRDAPIHFTIIGKGQTTQLVQHLAKQLDTRNVTFIDEVPFGTIPRHLAPADISLGIFGTTEKCRCVVPNKVYESIAMGKCVITGDTPAIREEFTPDEHLVVVACGDDKGLADSIRVLCSDDALRERISRQGRKRFVERLSTEKIAQRLKFLEDRLR